nr:hypothetical protein [Candidatus Sigynarchaeota archaeon]
MPEKSPSSLPIYKANTILIIPFSELGTKSEASRKKMMDQLLTNIKHVLKNVFLVEWVKFRVLDERLVFSFKEEDIPKALNALQHVPGIMRMHPCAEIQTRIASIEKKVREIASRGYKIDPEHTEIRALYFKDKVQKTNIIEQTRNSIAAIAKEVPSSMQVPGTFMIEIHPDFSYISASQQDGLNGHPVGTQNPIIAEILGRPGDLLASLLVIKRGIVITPVFFSIGGLAIDQAVYTGFLQHAKHTIELFHGFPVKKFFFVPLGKVLSIFSELNADAMKNHPCSCCILARRLIMDHIMTELKMARFIVQGTSPVPTGEKILSCPVEKQLNDSLNVSSSFLLNPLISGGDSIPKIFVPYLDKAHAIIPNTRWYTWDFCKLRSGEADLAMDPAQLEVIIELLKTKILNESAKFIHLITDNDNFVNLLQEK